MNSVNVPKLRFPGFEGEWESKKIGKIAELTSSKRVYLTDYVEKGIPFYRGKEISELKSGIIPNDILYITENSYEEFKNKFGVPQKDDLLITAVGTLGNVLRIKDDSKFYFKDGNLIWFRKINEDSSFLELALHVYKGELEKTSIGSTQRALTMVELRKLIFPFPTLPEQQKIASFLSAVDEKIQQLSRKKELLERYKKGVMQQLFSGKLRFKDDKGKEYPDWEIIKVQELINKKAIISLLDGNHGALYPKSEEFVSEGIPYVAANNLVNGQVKFSECKYLPEERAKKFKKGVAKNGDVLFAHNATVGPTALLKTELDYIILSTTVTYYRCDLNILSNTYLLHYFNSDNFIFQYTKVMSQSTRNQVPITMQKKFEIDFPSLPEQQKIANFLSGIDGKIEQVNGELVKTQEFKKGLLQQMFV